MEQNPHDAKAPYYLGNLYYDKRQYDLAMEAWETSARLDDNFPTVWRNLALAYFNKKNEETSNTWNVLFGLIQQMHVF